MVNTIYRYKSLGAKPDGSTYWDDHYVFYQGHWIFERDDWRVVEVPGKRIDVQLIGYADIDSFPVTYPIMLFDGSPVYKIENPIIPIT